MSETKKQVKKIGECNNLVKAKEMVKAFETETGRKGSFRYFTTSMTFRIYGEKV